MGLTVEQGLADTILGDVERNRGTLPLLEHALLETWQNRRGRHAHAWRATGLPGACSTRWASAPKPSTRPCRTRPGCRRATCSCGSSSRVKARRTPAAGWRSEVTTSDDDAVREVIRQFADAGC